MSNTHANITIIGHKECISFPELGLVDVPAKVDTGADSSAIWASNIYEEDGTLYFVLFDQISPFYTGIVLQAKKFNVISVKNSFGHTEFRYKVTLKITLAGRTMNVRFTLANRENNSQPILIGKRTLHGKFLVDVSAKSYFQGPSRMLLMSKKITPSVTAFVRGVETNAENIKITHATYDDIQFLFTNSGTRVTLRSTGEDVASFDIVHFKTSHGQDVTAAMARYLKRRGVQVVDEAALHFAATSKLYQYVILADNNITIPATVYVSPSQFAASFAFCQRSLGLPFVVKGIHASKGDHNYIVRTEADFGRVAKLVASSQVSVVAQQFIPNDGDYRVLVLGRRIALVIHRMRQNAETHLNNTSQGGNATLVTVTDLPTAVQTESLTAAKVMERGVAGVDMLEDNETGTWYCLEVNDGPQIASGSFIEEKQAAFAAYIQTELNK